MQFFQESSCAQIPSTRRECNSFRNHHVPKSQAQEENAIRLPTIQESSCTKSSEHKKRMQFFYQQFRNEHTFCGPGTGGVKQQHLCCCCKALEEEQAANQLTRSQSYYQKTAVEPTRACCFRKKKKEIPASNRLRQTRERKKKQTRKKRNEER
jgi:hypothetical protein